MSDDKLRSSSRVIVFAWCAPICILGAFLFLRFAGHDTFLTIGGVVIFAVGVWSFYAIPREIAKEENPNPPPLVPVALPSSLRASWRERRVRSIDWKGAGSLWGVTAFVAIAGYAFLAILDLQKFRVAIVFLGVIAGALMLLAMSATIRALLFGEMVCRLSDVPMVPGRAYSLVVETKLREAPKSFITVTLYCLHADVSYGQSGQRYDFNTTLYDHQFSIDPTTVRVRDGHAEIPVCVEIPANAPQIRSNANETVSWFLDVRVPVKRAEIFGSFRLPVTREPIPS